MITEKIKNRIKENKTPKSSEQKKIEEIKELLYAGKMSVLIGAGFSKNANEKFPTWIELLTDMVLEMYKQEYKEYQFDCNKNNKKSDIPYFVWSIASKVGYLEIVEKYINYRGMREAITFYIEDQFAEVNKKKMDYSTHETLLYLPWNNIYTTNYDSLLENASLNKNINYEIVKDTKNLALGPQKRIIKLHGSLRDQSDIDKNVFGFDGDFNKHYIIAKSDYDDYPDKHEAFTQLMKIALLQESFCLIGFSGEDPNFIRWIEWVRDVLNKDKKKVYLIDTSNKEISREKELFFTNYGIVHVSLKKVYEEAKVPKEKVKCFLKTISKPMIKEKEEQTQNLLRYEMLWDELKISSDLTELLKLEKYFTFPNQRILNYSENILTKYRKVLSEKIINEERKEKMSGISFLGLCLRNNYMPLSTIYKDEILTKIENSLFNFFKDLETNTEKKECLSLAIFILKNKRFNNDKDGFEKWKNKMLELKDRDIENAIIYEEAIMFSLDSNLEELEKRIKTWNLNHEYSERWFLVKKAFLFLLLNPTNTNEAFNLIKQAEKLMETNQDKLFILELKSYFEQGKTYIKSQETISKVKEYEALGCYRLKELDENFIIKEKKSKKINRFQNKPIILMGDYEDKYFFKSIFLTEFIINFGMPLRIGCITWITENDWEEHYKYLFEKNTNLGILLSLFYGGNDNDEKFIIKIFGLIKNSKKIDKSDKINILKKLIKIWDFNIKNGVIYTKILFAISELVKVVEYEVWKTFFINLWDEINKNEDLKVLIYRRIHGLSKPFSQLLFFIENDDLIEDIFIKSLNLQIKIGESEKSYLNHIYNLHSKYDFTEKQIPNFKRVKNLIEEKIKTKKLDNDFLIELYYLRKIIQKESTVKMKEYLLNSDFSKLKNKDLILEITDYDIEIKEKFKEWVLQNLEKIINNGIKGTGRSYSGDINMFKLIVNERIDYTIEENIAIYNQLKNNFNELEKWYSKANKNNFFKNMDIDFLSQLKIYIIEKVKKLNGEIKEEELFLKRIEKLLTYLRGYDTLEKGLISNDPDEYLNAIKLLYINIKENLEGSFHFDFNIFLINILSKRELRFEESINYLTGIINLFKNIHNPWILEYKRHYLEILKYYKDYYDLETDIQFREDKLIRIAYLLKTNYRIEDDIIEYWIERQKNNMFLEIKLMKLEIE